MLSKQNVIVEHTDAHKHRHAPPQCKIINLADEGLDDAGIDAKPVNLSKAESPDILFANSLSLDIDNIFVQNNLPTPTNEDDIAPLDSLTRVLSDGQRKTYQYLVDMNLENVTNDKLIETAAMFGNNTGGAINYILFDDPDDSNIAEPDFLTAISRSNKVDQHDLVTTRPNINTNKSSKIKYDEGILNAQNKKSHTLIGFATVRNELDQAKLVNKRSITLMGSSTDPLDSIERTDLLIGQSDIPQNHSHTLMGICDKNQTLNINNAVNTSARLSK
eukprot:234547_1